MMGDTNYERYVQDINEIHDMASPYALAVIMSSIARSLAIIADETCH